MLLFSLVNINSREISLMKFRHQVNLLSVNFTVKIYDIYILKIGHNVT